MEVFYIGSVYVVLYSLMYIAKLNRESHESCIAVMHNFWEP